ncbi:hypothetical protein [Halalkalibacter sp. APA_J-10(15)]|uniref:hypothetical protein n=1 Tax=Halalkalibacter sp. APA_J-10(15) TaxID=2933805 RepID=UPI001FF64E6D|nr:hypothetical protein [Halalkalibacter sp. APA_J-10(15)]MCK0470226.1 hypothetical protein [Halalkalibacter sp. APA_J-10(15)]
MNRHIFIPFLWIVILFMSGCVKAEYHIIFHDDGSAEIELFTGITEMMAGLMESEGLHDEQLFEEGYTLTEESINGYRGIKANKRFTSFNDIELPISNEELPTIFRIQEQAFSYEVNFLLEWIGHDLSGQPQSENPLLEGLDEAMVESFDLTFQVTLPDAFKIHHHNADRMDDQTLIWQLSLHTDQTVELNGEFSKPIPYLTIIIAISILIILVILTITAKIKIIQLASFSLFMIALILCGFISYQTWFNSAHYETIERSISAGNQGFEQNIPVENQPTSQENEASTEESMNEVEQINRERILDPHFLNDASRGEINGIHTKIGAPISSVIDAMWGLPVEERPTEGGYYLMYDECACGLGVGYDYHEWPNMPISTIYLPLSMSTNEIKQALGPPYEEGYSELDGLYYLYYEANEYRLFFTSDPYNDDQVRSLQLR